LGTGGCLGGAAFFLAAESLAFGIKLAIRGISGSEIIGDGTIGD
jgi:hypothetical protein